MKTTRWFGCLLSAAHSSCLLTATFLSTLMASYGGAEPSSPDPNAPRPPVNQNGFVQHTETIVVRVPMEALIEWRRSVSLESILHGTKRIPWTGEELIRPYKLAC